MRVPQIAIVGGGITGLTAAYRLQTLARSEGLPLRITLLERAPTTGGKLRTEHTEGFLIEAGPDIFLARKHDTWAFCEELGLAGHLIPTDPERRGSYIRRGERLFPLPEGLSGLVPTRLWPLVRSPLLSPGAKLRMAADWLLPARTGDDDESVGAFIRRRLGHEVFERLVDPLLGGIYGGPGDTLSLHATFPQLRALERAHGSLLRGLLVIRKQRPEQGPPFFSFREGMGTLARRLHERLTEVHLHTGVAVERVERAGERFRLHADGPPFEADAVLLTTPAHVAAGQVAALAPALARALAEIPYGSTATLSLAYPREAIPRPLDAYGYIIPRTEGTPVLACTWSSAKLPGRAPEGYALLRVFLGRAGNDDLLELDDEALLTLARDELRSTMGITAPPLLYRLYRWRRAMPQYTLGHPDRLRAIERHASAIPGLFLAGAAYRGVGIPDCIRSGQDAAHRILAYLRRQPHRGSDEPAPGHAASP